MPQKVIETVFAQMQAFGSPGPSAQCGGETGIGAEKLTHTRFKLSLDQWQIDPVNSNVLRYNDLWRGTLFLTKRFILR